MSYETGYVTLNESRQRWLRFFAPPLRTCPDGKEEEGALYQSALPKTLWVGRR